jgi:solute carrier family 25 protein 39/40
MKYAKVVDTANYTMPLWIPLIAGCSARIFAVTIVNPLELIRTKMQSEKMSYSEVGTAFNKMLKQHGARGLFKGLTPTILRDTPFSSIYWTCYESFKKYNGIIQPDVTQSFIGGALAGTMAALITCPFDVIKTHQQIEFGEKFIYSTNGNGSNGMNNNNNINIVRKPKPMSSMKQTLKNILQTSGVRGLFAGLVPRLCKVAPACAIMISTYEYGKLFFHTLNVKTYYEQNPERRNFS